MLKKVYIIVNPAAGNNEPILSYLNDALHKSHIFWEVFLTHGAGDAKKFAENAVKAKVDAVVVYGGDGTVMEVAQGLYNTAMPLAIIPGGTANVLAKELGIPTDTKSAIDLLKEKKTRKKVVDMGLYDDTPFVIRINVGVLADMVKSTPRSVKDKFGRLAYVTSAIKHIVKSEKKEFRLLIDGKKVRTKGVALVIANSGNLGVTGLSFLPSIDITDGLLDVIVFRNKNIKSLIDWAQNIIGTEKPSAHIRHWKAKEVTITFEKEEDVICDDVTKKKKEIHAKISPKALTVIVPKDS